MDRRTGQCNGGSASDAGHGSVAEGRMSAATNGPLLWHRRAAPPASADRRPERPDTAIRKRPSCGQSAAALPSAARRGVRVAEGTRLEIAYLPKGGSRV